MNKAIMLWSSALIIACLSVACVADPTDGFTSLPLSTSNFQIQKPYDVAISDRYSYVNGVHKMWVYSTDKPHTTTSNTLPRTEIRVLGYDYSSGVWQFEGYVYVPSGTSGVSIMQVFGGSPTATTLMLRVYGGDLTYYRSPVIVSQMYGRWLRVNVIHDVNAAKVLVYIDGVWKLTKDGRGGNSFHFKFGVYGQDGMSSYMESRWTGIKVLRQN